MTSVAVLIASVVISVTPADKPAAITEKIREARKARPAEELRVKFAPGRYEFAEPLHLGLAESGSEKAKIVFEGDGKATISAATVLKGWKDEGAGVWSCPAPRNAKGELTWFNSLWANGRRAECARIPSEGFYRVDEYHFQPYDGKETGNGCWEWINLRHSDLSAFRGIPQVDLDHVMLKGNHKWMHSSHVILGWDPPNSTFKIEVNSRRNYARWDHESLVWFENVRGGFDRPGEWFYDWANAKICYRPLAGEKIENFTALAPASRIVSVLEIVGDPENENYVTDLVFDGIDFEGTTADGMHERDGMIRQYQRQAAPMAGGAIYTRGAKRIVFRNCRVSRTENHAFRFDEGTMHVKVVGCELTDLGCGGVFAGNRTGYPTLVKPKVQKHPQAGHLDNATPTEVITDYTPLSVAFLEIDDCLVSGGGRYNPSACGFTLTHVSDSKITHNEIADMFYTGVSIGWVWGYGGSVAQRNTVAFNRIHDFGKYVMADMGGVYTLGASFGTCISNNVIYNVSSPTYGGWGMYNDEGSEGTTWENNIVYNTTTSSYHLHFGRDNVVRNNIMGYQKNERIIVSASNPKDHGVLFDRNIVIWDEQHSIVGGQVFRFDNAYGGWEPGAVWTNNLFWCTTEKWDLGGAHGTYADPKFVDPANRDFRLQPDSPAFALGFKPIDASLAGRRKK